MSEIINLGDFKFDQNHDVMTNPTETVDFEKSFLTQNLGGRFSYFQLFTFFLKQTINNTMFLLI